LRSLNWRVIRIWEHSLKSPPAQTRVVTRLRKALGMRHSRQG
jgi:G:T-mismatch repair DNA endonuclease (very short patch repair protein)